MPDNVAVTPGTGATLAADDIGGVLYPRQKLTIGADGVDGGDVSASNPLPITGALTDAQLRATAVPVSGAIAVSIGGSEVSSGSPMPVQEVGGATSLLSRILNVLMSPMGFDRSLSRQRVTGIIESGTVTTVTTVSTVSSMTNVANIGGYSAQVQVVGINLTAWAQCMRARIT